MKIKPGLRFNIGPLTFTVISYNGIKAWCRDNEGDSFIFHGERLIQRIL